MNTATKILILVIIGLLGVFILTLIKESRGATMGFFGLWGVGLYFAYRSMFSKKSENKSLEKEEDEFKLKK